jgi:GxxExxY protein
MVIALRRRGLNVRRQIPVVVHYGGEPVGRFFADLVVENTILVELKACRALDPAHESQVQNYLRATRLEVGLILHFGPKPAVRRFILTNDRKRWFVRGDKSAGNRPLRRVRQPADQAIGAQEAVRAALSAPTPRANLRARQTPP